MLAQRRNIILFMPDEMRADSLACYGNPVTRTPNFDRMAREGARFDQCHVQFPVCGASRCAMLTGWPTSVRGHRSLYYFLRPEEPNIFRYLRRADYDVFWFGKNDALAAQSFHDSVTRWSDDSMLAGMRTMPQSVTPGSMSMLYGAIGDRREGGDYRHLQMALDVLKRREQDNPFCIFLPLNEPHPPYTAPADFYDMYSPASLPPLIPPRLNKKPDFHTAIRSTYGLDKLDDATLRKLRAVYYGQVSYSDWMLGELMEALEATGHRDDTALLVTSDHGDYAGDYGLVEKWPSGLEDCLTRVPLLARVPGGKAGVVGREMREMFDIMQTCLDIAGIPPETIHTHFSLSLLPQIAGEPGDAVRAAFSEGGYNVYEPQCFEPMGPEEARTQARFGCRTSSPSRCHEARWSALGRRSSSCVLKARVNYATSNTTQERPATSSATPERRHFRSSYIPNCSTTLYRPPESRPWTRTLATLLPTIRRHPRLVRPTGIPPSWTSNRQQT
jgi:arylsulfatase A-like enzyme